MQERNASIHKYSGFSLVLCRDPADFYNLGLKDLRKE